VTADAVTLSRAAYLELLRLVPLAKSILPYLELRGGQATRGQITDDLGISGRTWDNNLPRFRELGLRIDGIVVALPSGNPVRTDEESVTPTSGKLEGNDCVTVAPESGKAEGNDRESVSPTSGSIVQHEPDASPRVGAHEGVSSSGVDVVGLGLKPKTTNNKPRKPPADPPTRDAMFDAVAVATYGGLEGIGSKNAALIGAAKKEFVDAGYSPEDVLSIGAWLRHRDPWRSDIKPMTLVGVAPSWRNAGRTPPRVTEPRSQPTSRRRERDLDDPERYRRE
jgi:hypothetical protein